MNQMANLLDNPRWEYFRVSVTGHRVSGGVLGSWSLYRSSTVNVTGTHRKPVHVYEYGRTSLVIGSCVYAAQL